MMDATDVQKRINERFDKLFTSNSETGAYQPYVCLICDEMLKPNELTVMNAGLLEQRLADLRGLEPVSDELRNDYKYEGELPDYVVNGDFMSDILLSPRATLIKASDGRSQTGFSCCKGCKNALLKGYMPKFAIANNYCLGTPPQCLLNLTDVELAMLTPVKTYGYCFSYTGGIQKQLKGSLSYYKVKISSIVRSVMHFDVLGLNKNIVVLLYGNMTPEQRQKAREKNKIRTDAMLTCVQWLLSYHEEWKRSGITLEEIRRNLRNPVLIDNSKTVGESDSGSNNVENTETFEVFFPDGSMCSSTGGQENLEKFQGLVEAATENGYDLEFRNNLYKEAVSDFKDNNLVNACLLQFPYGRGGMHEPRLKSNGSTTVQTDISEYVEHLSRLSQPHMHQDLFTLILYNLMFKQNMVRTAGWKVRDKTHAECLAVEITTEDISSAIGGRRNGTRGNSAGHRFLNAVDAISGHVPHTNEAAKRARRDGEAIQHHFGTVSYFLTVTPDDNNSLIVQILSGVQIDDDTPIGSLTDAELAERARERTKLRIKFPGLCAYFFELALEIILEEVVGWDLEKGVAREGGGLFGIPEAFTATIEEQGRKTLHGHIQVWIKKYNEWREKLHSTNRHIRREAAEKITTAVDQVSSCAFFFAESNGIAREEYNASFPHVCSAQPYCRRKPVVVDNQQLRNLRHKEGQHSMGGMFVYCPHCTMSWNSTELVESYLINAVKIPGLTSYPDNTTGRLKAMAVEFQKTGKEDFCSRSAIRAGYNFHMHSSRSCFGKAAKLQETGKGAGRKRKLGKNYECRHRSPQLKKRRTVIKNASETTVKWYKWDGSCVERHIKEVCVQRHPFDAFQNVSCPAVSESKLTCNSNVSAIMPGPIGQYAFKYNLKDTQEEDTEAYKHVAEAMQKVLSKLRTHQSDRSEAVRRLLAATFAHQKTNVVGAPMAAFLTRRKSRFIFSHKTTWCPLRDIKAVLRGEAASVMLMHHGKVPFFQCSALHYLCRPEELEELSPFEFYSQYEVIRVTRDNVDELLKLKNGCFQHPSYRANEDSFLQGVRERTQHQLIKVFQYDFADTAEFSGSLLDPNCVKTDTMEQYCELALLLLYPYRELADLQLNGSFVDKLRDAISNGSISDEKLQFLQNIQDAKSNSFRVARLEDELQRVTESFRPADEAFDEQEQNDQEQEEGVQGEELEELLKVLDLESNATSAGQQMADGGAIPKTFALNSLRQKGTLKCGYEHLAQMQTEDAFLNEPVLEVEAESMDCQEQDSAEATGHVPEQSAPTQRDIVSLLISKTSRRRRTFEEITKSKKVVNVLEANGSVRSIIDWAKKAKLDRKQRRAFEIFTGTFVLSFFRDAESDGSRRHTFVKEKKLLNRLVEVRRRGSDQLVCLLHGPGGSGKTTVVDLVTEYAREYCSYLDNYEFTSRTIVVTAMTGVAATILLGETTHSAVYLNQKRPLEAEQIEAWAETRLLIIDEVSFASKEDFAELHRKIRRLKQCLHLPYGGLDIIFSGDMRQLEPVGKSKKPVYSEDCPEFKDWVNCFIELDGMHRFKGDREWGYLLFRFRDGEMTESDIDCINECVVDSSTVLPENLKYATYYNRDRDAINSALFEERCKQLYQQTGNANAVMIFSDNVEVRNSNKKYVPFQNCHTFWENCGEDDVKLSRGEGRMDPVLKLYRGCPVMLPCNTNVKQGQANGTQATVEKVVLKYGEQPTEVLLAGEVPVSAVKASQVSHVILKHTNDRIHPDIFTIAPKKHSYRAKILKPRALQIKGDDRDTLQMRSIQVPLLINNATTGHKLQGSGVDNLFVHNCSYITNWVDVMLSRVKTRSGLFARKKLSKDLQNYEALHKMLAKFHNKAPTYWTEEQYNELFDL